MALNLFTGLELDHGTRGNQPPEWRRYDGYIVGSRQHGYNFEVMRKCCVILAVVLLIAPLEASLGASARDIDRLTTFAVMLGRAIGCGLAESDSITLQVGTWVDKKFPPGSADQRAYYPIFLEGIRLNAEAQAKGRSPDNCNAVSRFFRSDEFKRAIRD